MTIFICFWTKEGSREYFFVFKWKIFLRLLQSAPHVGDISVRRIKSCFWKLFLFFINFVTFQALFVPQVISQRVPKRLSCVVDYRNFHSAHRRHAEKIKPTLRTVPGEEFFFIDSICLAVPFGKRYALIPRAAKKESEGKVEGSMLQMAARGVLFKSKLDVRLNKAFFQDDKK